MKFKLENFLELDTTQLLAVNGGSGCGGSSGGGSSGGSSSSSGGGSSGGGSSSSGSSSSSSGGGGGGGSCGGASSSVTSTNGGGSSSGGSGGGSCGGASSSIASSNGGGVSSGGGSCGDSTSAITTTVSSVKTVSSGGGTCSRVDLSQYKQPQDGSWGEIEKGSANEKSTMQDYRKFAENAEMNGTSIKDGQEVGNLFSEVGCKMEGAAKISTEILGTNVDIRDVNNKYDVNKDGLLTQSEIASGIKAGLGKDKTLSTDSYSENTLNKAALDAIAASKEGTTYILGRAEGVAGGQHWVVLEGYSMNDRGQVQFKFNGTSENDAGRTYILEKPDSDQTNTYTISKVEIYTVK